MTKTIKLNNVEVSVDEIRQLVKDNPELLKEDEKPLGDNFSMLEYLNDISLGCSVQERKYTVEVNYIKRLNALITIWEWKEENDGKFGVEEVMAGNYKYIVYYSLNSDKFDTIWSINIQNSELPHFSSQEISERARKELEQEYRVVFNVK